MVVFDQDFVQQLERVNSSRPASYRSDLYFFVTSEDRRDVREWVERTVALLPDPGRTLLAKRLRADGNFVTAIQEIGVAAVLFEAGLSPESEPRLGRLTPDLFVPGSSDRPPLVFEVWTRQPQSGESSRRRSWQALVERVEKIPHPVGLLLVPRTRRCGAPDRQEITQIGRELSSWLAAAQRHAGESHEVLGYRFQVAGSSPYPDRAFLPRPTEGGTVDTDIVMEIVREKTRRYRQMVTDLGAAFVVVLAGQPDTAMDLDMVRATLDGRQAMTFLVPPSPSGPLGDVTMRMKAEHSPPVLDGALSAVGWLSTTQASPTLNLFENPRAVIPLPDLPAERITRERLPSQH